MADAARLHSGIPTLVQVPVADGTAVAIGDMLRLTGALGVVVTADTDNLALYAVALQAHASGDGAITINCARVMPGTIWYFLLNAATDVAMGEELQINAAQTLKKSASNPVANVVMTELAATTVLAEFKYPVLLLGDTA